MRSKLAELHKRLKRLKRRRQRVRWGTAYSAVALAVLWVLAGAFLIDWLLEMDQLQRAIALVLYAGATAWMLYRYALPWLGFRETELDMALLVERTQHIDTDLTAAVQFEWPEAPEWGSTELEQAVIEQVSTTTPRLDVSQSVPRQYLSRRMMFLLATLGLWAAVAFLCPRHVAVFFDRLLLGSLHYPTQTVITKITVNGKEVDPANPTATRISARYGAELNFEVTCEGDKPTEGEARLKAIESGLRTAVSLEPVTKDSTTFVGKLPKLYETVRYQIYLGDAWTDPSRLAVTTLPNIEVQLEVIPPQYDESEDVKPQKQPANLRQISVAEGSRVAIRLRSDKHLKESVCTVGEQPYPLKAAEQAADALEHWNLESEGTPLANVTEPVRYAIQVTDEEDEQLEKPFQGVLRVQPDAPPRVAAAAVTRVVLPMARPRIYYRALDDHGLATLSLLCEISGASGGKRDEEVTFYTHTKGQPPKPAMDDSYRLDLSKLKLAKGDQVKVTLRAVDWRGPREGKAALSEPIVLQVSDEDGVLAAVTETYPQMAERMDIMLQRQLGIGEAQ